MSCDNCDCTKCKASRQPVGDGRVFKKDLKPEDRQRYSDPKHWCQCGAWKYHDALSCDVCWARGDGYADR